MKKIFITGGHFAPAKAVISKLSKDDRWQIYYLGRQYSMEDDQALALEYQEIKELPNVNYLVINTGRLQPKFFVNLGQSIKALLKIFLGLGQSLFWILRYRPDVVLSFGGYVALPVVFWAWLLGIPVATHEQTVVSGKANKIISLLADRILVSWPDSLAHFPAGKSVLTGNPLRPEVITYLHREPPTNKPPKILIAGGNQGSHAINLALEASRSHLIRKYSIIHLTGDSSFRDFDRLKKFAGQNYQPKKSLTGREFTQALWQSDLIVSRAGANTVTEILALGKTALLIPIPWSSHNEQLKNAQMVRASGLAEILSQDKLTGATLEKSIDQMFKNKETYLKNRGLAQKAVPSDAAEIIASEVMKLINQ